MTGDHAVITGAGAVCSLGTSAPETWKALVSGRTGIRPIEGVPAEGSAAQIGPLDTSQLDIHPRDSRIMGMHSYLLMMGCQEAYHQARLESSSLPREEIGFFAGLGMVDYEVEDLLPAVLKSLNPEGGLDYDAFYSGGYKEIYPLWPLSMLNNIAFCQSAIRFDLQGENAVFSPHADSGAMAVAEGVKCLIDHRARAVICAGVGEKVGPFSLARARSFGVLGSPGQEGVPCRPFDAERRGTVLGEGAGVICLELHSSARRRGVPCLASVTGYGASCEAESASSGPTARAIGLAMREALDRAGVLPSDVDAVIGHGDGTADGDRLEIEAINCLFSASSGRPYVFSSKGALGHLLAGAPLLDVILAAFMLRDGIVPETLHVSAPDPAVRFNLVHHGPVKADLRRVLINCRSVEGQAASLVVEAAGEAAGRGGGR